MLLKFIKVVSGLLLSVLVLSFAFLSVGDTDAQSMIAKYGSNAIGVDDGVGGTIYYRDEGNKNGPVLLLIHGSNSSMQTWNELVKELGDRYRLISYDQHGHGITGPHQADDYTAQAKINTALRVLDDAGVEKAIWVGNSMGGWVTWRATLESPERVSAMVLIDASGVVGGETVKLYLGAKLASSRFGQMIAPYILPKILIEKSVQKNYFDTSKVTDQLVDQYWQMLRFPGNRTALAKITNTTREPEYWNNIDEITHPTLILWGEHDFVLPVSHASLFKQKLPQSELKIYPDAGHLPMEEIPEKVAKDIDDWVQLNLIF